jgi:apolipoprotein N-acyltransferase
MTNSTLLAARRALPDLTLASPLARLALAAAISGLAMGLLALSEWPWIVLGFFGLVPWLYAVDRSESFGSALLAGILMSVTYMFGVGYWVPSTIQGFSGAPWIVSLLVMIVISPILQPQFIALSVVRHLAKRGKPIRFLPIAPLAGACAYVGAEWLLPDMLGDTLGHWLVGSEWIRQGADVAGALGLTFVLLLANECMLAIVKSVRGEGANGHRQALLAPLICLALLVLAPLGYGAARLHEYTKRQVDPEPVKFAIVQAGFNNFGYIAEEYGTYLGIRTILDTHIALSRDALQAQQTDVLVWAENVYPLTFGAPDSEQHAVFDRRIGELVQRTGIPLVFGARDFVDGQWFNAAFLLQPLPDAEIGMAVYHKVHLFPLAEYAPRFLDWPFARRLLPWMGTFSAGPGPQVASLTLPDGRSLQVAPLICYDALQSSHVIAAVRGGAEVIVTLSNDSWFEHGIAPHHLLNISRFRSIETRRPQVRAAVTGISAVITPTGEIVDRIESREFGSFVAAATPAHGTTLMLRLGDWFGPTAIMACLLLLSVALARRVRPRGNDHQV